MDGYPEHDKLDKINENIDAIHTIVNFLEDLLEKNIVLCKAYNEYEFSPITTPPSKLVADHFGINLVKLEEEKQDMVKKVRGYTKASQ